MAEEIKNEGAECTAETPKKKKKVDAAALEAKIAELEAALAEANDKHLRMAAEYENFRRRSKEEREGTYAAALTDTVAEILPIIDNLERAAQFDDGEKVRDGLKMIAGSVESVLTKLGVESFGKPGEKFDPNIHNAIMHDEDDSEREGEITDVFQKGYKRGARVIRFAMVKTVN